MDQPSGAPDKASVLRLRGTVLCGSLWMLIAMAGDYGALLDTEATLVQMAADDSPPLTDAGVVGPRRRP